MHFELIRQLPHGDEQTEFLCRIDEEFLDIYREETGEKDFNQETFNQWITDRMAATLEGEEWRYED